jgi:hypothetical protein
MFSLSRLLLKNEEKILSVGRVHQPARSEGIFGLLALHAPVCGKFHQKTPFF